MKFVQFFGSAPLPLPPDSWEVLEPAASDPNASAKPDVVVFDVEEDPSETIELAHGYRAQKPDLPRVILRDAHGFYDLELARLARVYCARSQHPLRMDWILRQSVQPVSLPDCGGVVARERLPLLSDAARALIERWMDPELDLVAACEEIEEDEELTKRVLAIANSAFFSLAYRVSDLEDARDVLEETTLRCTVIAALVFARFEDFEDEQDRRFAKHIRDMSILRLRVATVLDARDESLALAAMLLDVGRLVQLQLGGDPTRSLFPTVEELDAEAARNGIDSGLLSAYVLEAWGMPTSLVHAVAAASWDCPQPGAGQDLAHTVRIASALAAEGFGQVAPLSLEWMQGLGVLHAFYEWREMVADMAMAWPGA